MLDRFADWLDRQAPGRRRLYSVFIALALLTIPCYASATLLWFFDIPGAGNGVDPAAREQATGTLDPVGTTTLAIPTVGDEDPRPEPPVSPTERPREDEDPEPTLAPRPTTPPLPTATEIVVPTPVLRASPSAASSPTPEPTEPPTAAPTETEARVEPTEAPTDVPVEPSPTPPIQVTLDP